MCGFYTKRPPFLHTLIRKEMDVMDKKPFCQSQAMEYITYLCILAERNDTDGL